MGLGLNPASDDAPTNPMFQMSSGTISNGDRIYTAIMEDDASTVSVSGWGGSITENSNLATTKGFRIKCYDALTTTGVRFNPTTTQFADNDYYVLIHSDNSKKHHFARITEVITEDEYGDAFEFEPKLGNEIAKDTKFIIFGAIDKDLDIVAISLGIKQETDTDFEGNLICARPIFYFHESKLDKKEELNHNTKYYAMQNAGSGNTFTLAYTASPSGARDNHTFRTVQDFGSAIVDYSKYSLKVSLTDKLRDLDVASGGSTTTNEGNTVSLAYHDYEGAYPNARRDANDNLTSLSYTGPKRYIHYAYSPDRANHTYGVLAHKTFDSFGKRGGISETKIVDPARVMGKKIEEFTDYKVRHRIAIGNLNDFFELQATYDSVSSNDYTFNTDFDLRDFLNAGDELKIGTRVYVINTVNNDFSNFSQTLTMENISRLEKDTTFGARTDPTSGDKVYRSAYNFTDKTLMTDVDLIDGRFSKLYVMFNSQNMGEMYASVTNCDANKKLLTLSFTGDSYYDDPMKYTSGEYLLFVERFTGEIEEIKTSKQQGQTIIDITGRDKINKLLSPIIDLDSMFSEDIIYSSQSPYNKLGQIHGNNFTIDLGATTLATGLDADDFTNLPKVGDKLFTVNGYIGEVSAVSDDPVELTFSASITDANSEIIYVETEKNYILSKALGSSHLTVNSPTSLTGGANKGVIFTGGNKIDMSDGSEGDALSNTSNNSHPEAVGYAINSPSSISKDNLFQAKLHDEFGSADPSTFDTVNTLMDFEVVSFSKKKNFSEIELAPYIPITLGRKVEYHINTEDYSFTEVATVTTIDSSSNDLFFRTTSSTAYDLNAGDSLFVGDDKKFVGKVSRLLILTTSTSGALINVYLDRTIHNFTVNEKVYTADKKLQDISFINGAHLWGGKILTVPHPVITTDGVFPLNIENVNSGSDDMNEKHGQMYYKMTGINIGNFPLERGITKDTFFSTEYIIPRPLSNKSLLNFHSQVYQFKPNISSDNLIEFDKTDSAYRTFPLDYRGHTSVLGSNANNTRIWKNQLLNNLVGDGFELQTSKYTGFDESALRLFLYINSDIMPYSSRRKDSLMRSDKTLENYSMLMLENKNSKDSSFASGDRVSLRDSNFQTIPIQGTTDLSSLKRFGLMRLTEVCFDFLFNPINPEKPTLKRVEGNLGVSLNSYDVYLGSGQTELSEGVSSISGTTIVFDNNIDLTDGDKVYDKENGQYIGEIATTATGTATHTLESNGKMTQDGSAANTAIIIATNGNTIYGKNSKDSLYKVDSDAMHPLKCAIVPTGSDWGEDTNDKYQSTEESNGASPTYPSKGEIILPIFTDKEGGGLNGIAMKAGDGNSSVTDIRTISNLLSAIGNDDYGLAGTIGVVLDRYSVEDGSTTHRSKAGLTTQVLAGLAETEFINQSAYHVALKDGDYSFKSMKNIGDTSSDFLSRPYGVDGAYMCFKPRLFTGSLTTANIKSSNGNLVKNPIDVSAGKNYFLNFMDLTGCYLVTEYGKHISGESVTGADYTFHGATKTIDEDTATCMNNVSPQDLIYVASHEIDSTNKNSHILITNIGLLDTTAYRILQPNEVCLYDFFPEKLNINMLSSDYTKESNRRRSYDIKDNYILRESQDLSADNILESEGVLSMFVIVDPDKQSSSPNLVKNSIDGILDEGQHSLYFSDGEESKKMDIRYDDVGSFETLTLSKKVNMNGVVSVSEPFTVTSLNELEIEPTRVAIGSTVSVCLEAQDLMNELFEQNDIQFDITDNDYPLYLAPNFKGIDLYSAIRFILEKKDMSLKEENDTYFVKPNDDASYLSNIIIDDRGKFKIYDFRKTSTLFDFYNEVIVYGSSHKSTRKDLRSIQKRGRKSLEHHDSSLVTQEEVDKKAIELLRLHSTFNTKLEFTISTEGIHQLRAGDTINVEITSENLPLAKYIVLQIEHTLTGLMKLQLGRYSKELSDLFSEIITSNKQINSRLRNDKFNEKSTSYNFLETLKLKELKLLIRKMSSTGEFRLGFSKQLNTGTDEFGFAGGSITITDLLEEDLA